MNDLKSFENQLRQWTPRRPSAELQATLFSRKTPEQIHPNDFVGGIFRWLVPAAGCFALLLSGINLRNAAHSGNPILEPGFATYSSHSEQNNVPVSHFELALTSSVSSATQIPFNYSDTN